MNKSFEQNAAGEKNIFLCAARGLAAALVTSMSLACALAALASAMDDPDKYTGIFALAALFTGAVCGGFVTALARGKNAVLCGAVTGLMMIAVMVMLAFSFALGMNMSLFLICAPSIIVTATLGAISGAGKREQKKKRKKKKF